MIAELIRTITKWIRWLRFQRAALWALRGLLMGLAISFVFSLIFVAQARLLRAEFLALVGILSLAVTLSASGIAFFWPVEPLKAARYFDLVFHLDERVSTALELSRGGRTAASEMTQRQLENAVLAARGVQPNQSIPLRMKKLEGLLALVFLLLIGLVWFHGESWFQAAAQARLVERAVAEQEASIEELISQIQDNNSLSEEQKKALTIPLEEALKGLEDNSSLEGSVSVLASTSEKLQALSNPQMQQLAQALKETGSQLAGQEGSPLQSVGQSLSEGNVVAAASELANLDVSNLSQSEAQALANQLESMAQALASTDSGLASQLNSAAEALREGDTAVAQQALNQVAQSLSKAGQQVIFSQTASQAAGQMQQGAGQVLAAGGGQGAGQDGQASAQGEGSGSSQGTQASGQAGAGSGSGSDAGSSSQGSEAGSAPIPQNNAPGDGGETAYEQIYAPTLLGGEDGQLVGLPDSSEDGTVIGEGPSTPSEPGQSLVPYDQVYAQYEQANRQAIENSDVPVQFMQIIRNYFDSLEP